MRAIRAEYNTVLQEELWASHMTRYTSLQGLINTFNFTLLSEFCQNGMCECCPRLAIALQSAIIKHSCCGCAALNSVKALFLCRRRLPIFEGFCSLEHPKGIQSPPQRWSFDNNLVLKISENVRKLLTTNSEKPKAMASKCSRTKFQKIFRNNYDFFMFEKLK